MKAGFTFKFEIFSSIELLNLILCYKRITKLSRLSVHKVLGYREELFSFSFNTMPHQRRYSAQEALQRMMDIGSDESGESGDETNSDSDDYLPNVHIENSILQVEDQDEEIESSEESESSNLGNVFVSRDGVRWTTDSENLPSVGRFSYQNILRKNPGVKSYVRNRVSTALDAWEEMIDKKILETVVANSNANIPTNTPEITVEDLKKFIALQYARGLYGRHIPRDFLWSKQFGIQIFKDTMPRSKFRHLSKILRLDNKSTRSRRSSDRFTHIREVYERFVSNCSSKYVPEQDLTVD